jgi:hypothetical protein
MDYDVIGDIHGQADKLVTLLDRLGYHNWSGTYRHPDRTAVFVGDFIDGSLGSQMRTVEIVRGMVDNGAALAVMGNHEFNALAWVTPRPHADGEFLRSHSEKNMAQHKSFLAEVESKPKEYRQIVEWFMTLPLWLDLPEIRVVHACWHERSMVALAPHFHDGNRLTPQLLIRASPAAPGKGQPDKRDDNPLYCAIETLLKGVEIDLPGGHGFKDQYGHFRHEMRVRWWETSASTYKAAALLPPSADASSLPGDDVPLPPDAIVGYASKKPVFFGHYWMRVPCRLQSPIVACVDYSAAKSGPLVAYRWEGERELRNDHFIRSDGEAA